MSTPPPECRQLQTSLDRLRSLLENLAVRGLRACGEEEIVQLRGYIEELEQTGAEHVSSILSELQSQIQSSDQSAPRTLIRAQTAVRMLERLLTLRVVKAAYATAVPDDGDVAEGGAV